MLSILKGVGGELNFSEAYGNRCASMVSWTLYFCYIMMPYGDVIIGEFRTSLEVTGKYVLIPERKSFKRWVL